MDTQRIVTRFRLATWSDTVKQRIASGQSVKDFCKENKIGTNTYYYRQRKVREAAYAALDKNQVDDGGSRLVPNGWALCEPASEKTETSAMTVEIGSFKVSVDENFSPDLLTKVCKALVAVC